MDPRLKQRWVFPTFIQGIQANWWCFAINMFCEYLSHHISLSSPSGRNTERDSKKQSIMFAPKVGGRGGWWPHRRWDLFIEYNMGRYHLFLDFGLILHGMFDPSPVLCHKCHICPIRGFRSHIIRNTRTFCMHASGLLVYESHLYAASWHFILAWLHSGTYS